MHLLVEVEYLIIKKLVGEHTTSIYTVGKFDSRRGKILMYVFDIMEKEFNSWEELEKFLIDQEEVLYINKKLMKTTEVREINSVLKSK
jgi:hypothetical protein